MKELVYGLVFVGGAIIAVQAAINAKLGGLLGNNMHAVLASFVIGTVGAALYCLFDWGTIQDWEKVKSAPWWIWTGGLLGLCFVWSTIFAVPKIGVSVMFPLVVAGQMGAALTMEHFGLFGAPVQPISWGRVAGVVLVVAGAVVLALTRET